MIFVTVGTHGRGFDRLVAAMDALAARIEEPVVIQRGSSAHAPRHAEHFDFTTGRRMAELSAAARVIVAHAAAGTILTTMKLGKPLVVVPRLRRYGEVKDDHQRQLAGALHALGRVVAVDEPTPEALEAAIGRAAGLAFTGGGQAALVDALREQLSVWDGRRQAAAPARER